MSEMNNKSKIVIILLILITSGLIFYGLTEYSRNNNRPQDPSIFYIWGNSPINYSELKQLDMVSVKNNLTALSYNVSIANDIVNSTSPQIGLMHISMGNESRNFFEVQFLITNESGPGKAGFIEVKYWYPYDQNNNKILISDMPAITKIYSWMNARIEEIRIIANISDPIIISYSIVSTGNW
jgi:hypothetical protein